jgi:nitrogen fixation NifU-like protein
VEHDFIEAGSKMTQPIEIDNNQTESIRKMLAEAGYSQQAIQYYIEKPHMGSIPDAEMKSEMTGSCGDTMGICVKMDNGTIKDAKYEVMGCAGAVSAAMAAVDLIKGQSLEFARKLNDGDIFKVLEEIPVKKHHCIQLAVKTLHKAIDEYNGNGDKQK